MVIFPLAPDQTIAQMWSTIPGKQYLCMPTYIELVNSKS